LSYRRNRPSLIREIWRWRSSHNSCRIAVQGEI
jgi:hypothetical protein